jgi:hypothetical protein
MIKKMKLNKYVIYNILVNRALFYKSAMSHTKTYGEFQIQKSQLLSDVAEASHAKT